MNKYEKAFIAAGHPLVSEAAATIIREGGNAFDAVVGAGFASCVVEPALNSLGGGGFLLGHSAARGQNLFFDFFVDTPGINCGRSISDVHFFPVNVKFSGSSQEFNVGLGSVAVPGVLKGLLHIHRRLGRMGIRDIMVPAVKLARGHLLNERQAYFLKLLYPIMTLLPEGREIYEAEGNYLQEGDVLVNNGLVSFMERIAGGDEDLFYHGEIPGRIACDMEAQGGLLTAADLNAYRVIERTPLSFPFRGYDLLTSPAPSMGGVLIGLSMSLQSRYGRPDYPYGSGEYLIHAAALMQEVERIRHEGLENQEGLLDFLASDAYGQSVENIRLFSRGTTHISIADRDGNCASMTCSNGEGSGYFAPGTGVMLNNMMGEDDLHPQGFHSSPPGQRVCSMMSPSLLMKKGNVELVIGSGGSKRIRTAVTQVLYQVIDFNRSLREAVDAPRLHWDGEVLQIEPGFPPDAVEALSRKFKVNMWEDKGVYFGGVHAVIPGREGAADGRRGGGVFVV